MEVILLERIGRLGQMGDVVRVKDGYARNFLLPSGKALRATDANRLKFERDRETLVERNARTAGRGAGRCRPDRRQVVRRRPPGRRERPALRLGVDPRHRRRGLEGRTHVERNQVLLDSPIKAIGLHPVRIALHPEVVIEITVNVARSADEAAAQARGEVLVGSASDREEARNAAEALFREETETEPAEPMRMLRVDRSCLPNHLIGDNIHSRQSRVVSQHAPKAGVGEVLFLRRGCHADELASGVRPCREDRAPDGSRTGWPPFHLWRPDR